MPKITIIGAGNVGAQTAFICMLRELGDVVLLDVAEGIPQGKALDIQQAAPLFGSRVTVTGTNDYEDTKDSDIVVITAGIARKPGMSREDLLKTNAGIVRSVTEQAARYSPGCIMIVVTNPLDAMSYLACKTSKFPRQRVIGMAGVLDSARMRAFIAQKLGKPGSAVEALVLGTHGDSMVPLIDKATVSGKKLSDVMGKEDIDKIVERTRNGGAEIVGFLKTGSAFFAPAASVAEMIDSILNDRKKMLPCTVLLEGEYGFSDVFAGVPVLLGRKGAEEIPELELSPEEKENFDAAVKCIKSSIGKIDV